MRVLLCAVAAFALFTKLSSAAWTADTMPNPCRDSRACGRDVQSGKSRICDPDLVLTAGSRDVIEGIIQDVEAGRDPYATMQCDKHHTGWKVAVAVVQHMEMAPATDPSDAAEDFATKLHDKWGVGDAACNNGVLLLLAVQDRQVYISTGQAAMTALPNYRVQEVLAKMRPKLRAGQFDKAVEQAVLDIALLLAGNSIDDNSADGYDWALIVALTVMASLAGFTCYSSAKRSTEYRTCKNLLLKLRKDQETALRTKHYDSTSCPICMEDFEVANCSGASAGKGCGAAETDGKADSDGKSEEEPSSAANSMLSTPDKDTDKQQLSAKPGSSSKNNHRQPLVLPCGHRFCDDCISKWLDKASNINCPVCRKPIRAGDVGEATSSSRTPLMSNNTEQDAYERLFMPEARFRLAQLHVRYPYFVSTGMVDTWGNEMAHQQVMSAVSQVDSQMTTASRATHAQHGSVGISSDFGGGSSFGGGGGGSSW